jgi:hypothetical protein
VDVALSNWALAAINEKGKGTNGVFAPQEGVEIEIYKNWLYIRDTDNQGETHFHGPCVMQIQEGSLQYRNTTILAVRGPKQGVYVVAYTGNLYADKDNSWSAMLGIGCYGYDDKEEQAKWIGIEKDEVDFLETVIDSHFSGPISSIPLDNLVQINQGDAYIATKLGMEVPVVDIGHAVEPILTQALKQEAETNGST